MLRKYSKAIWFTAGTSFLCVLLSLLVTHVVLVGTGTGDPPIAYLLAALLPAVLAPTSILPLSILLERVRRMSRELQTQALTDPLTGLPNRRAFFERAEAILAAADAGQPVAAMMIDVDRFKAINDEFGHAGGDALLTAIGAAIRDTAAAAGAGNAVVARLGGEEFAVLVAGLVPTAVARLADRLCLVGRQTKATMGGVDMSSTVSIGVAMRTGRSGIDPLLKLADDAVYLAKRAGRDRWSFAGSLAAPHVMEGRAAARMSDRLPSADMAEPGRSASSLIAS